MRALPLCFYVCIWQNVNMCNQSRDNLWSGERKNVSTNLLFEQTCWGVQRRYCRFLCFCNEIKCSCQHFFFLFFLGWAVGPLWPLGTFPCSCWWQSRVEAAWIMWRITCHIIEPGQWLLRSAVRQSWLSLHDPANESYPVVAMGTGVSVVCDHAKYCQSSKL